MDDALASLPKSLRERARLDVLAGEIPALLAHPDWETPAPCCIWLHGRTVHKELDPGRYLRWLRAGIATCAIDLPAHGERLNVELQRPEHSLDVLEQAVGEIDAVVEALQSGHRAGVFDPRRVAIGGMSLGGMAVLRRLCDAHPFRAAAVEATTGWLTELYHPTLPAHAGAPWGVAHARERLARLDPMQRIVGWRPIPLLALHSESDQMVPWPSQREFLARLREHYASVGADPGSIEIVTWPSTGAPSEHVGFGREAPNAKDIQTAFLTRHLIG